MGFSSTRFGLGFGVLTAWMVVACGSERDTGSGGTGGAPITGGSGTGGSASGGISSTGGANPTGGSATGGAVQSGGMAAQGGTPGSGGTQAGAATTGGTSPSSGGASSTGGAAGNAGSGGTAGNAGGGGGSTAQSGGRANSGGNAGAAGSGGATGGATMTGGAGGSGGGSSSKRCTGGPFAATPMVVSSKSVCQNFNFDFSWNEGPTWVASQQAFFFTNFVAGSSSGGNIVKYTPGGNCEVFIRDVGCNGLAASNDGNLLAACQQTRSVVRFDLTTKKATTVADSYMGKQLDTPNDLVQHSNGSIYFSNPTNELAGRPVGVGRAAFRVDPSGTLTLLRESDSNGVALSPDEKKLYVLLSGMWDLDAQGVPSNRQAMFTTGDGMGVDCAGNVYTNGSIFSPSGQQIGTWGAGTNLAFGGEDGKTVLVTGSGKALRELTMNIPGLP